jgi:hypothetical protein
MSSAWAGGMDDAIKERMDKMTTLLLVGESTTKAYDASAKVLGQKNLAAVEIINKWPIKISRLHWIFMREEIPKALACKG